MINVELLYRKKHFHRHFRHNFIETHIFVDTFDEILSTLSTKHRRCFLSRKNQFEGRYITPHKKHLSKCLTKKGLHLNRRFSNLYMRNGPIVRCFLFVNLRISLYILILSRARARAREGITLFYIENKMFSIEVDSKHFRLIQPFILKGFSDYSSIARQFKFTINTFLSH